MVVVVILAGIFTLKAYQMPSISEFPASDIALAYNELGINDRRRELHDKSVSR